MQRLVGLFVLELGLFLLCDVKDRDIYSWILELERFFLLFDAFNFIS